LIWLDRLISRQSAIPDCLHLCVQWPTSLERRKITSHLQGNKQCRCWDAVRDGSYGAAVNCLNGNLHHRVFSRVALCQHWHLILIQSSCSLPTLASRSDTITRIFLNVKEFMQLCVQSKCLWYGYLI